MKGFFTKEELGRRRPGFSTAQCHRCRLWQHCHSPKMPVSGKGHRKILLVAEAPGEMEDDRGIQFCGKSGQLLERKLAQLGIQMRRDCWLTNSIICRPPDNETPTSEQLDWCRPNLIATIEEHCPRVIIAMGAPALESLIRDDWTAEFGGIGRWVGVTIPSRRWNAWICPVYHPAYLIRQEPDGGGALDSLFLRHLRRAIDLAGEVPYPAGPPPVELLVEIITDDQRAAKILRQMIRKGGTVAFDYETNMLKPDSEKAAIVSCSVCWEGRRTIAFPFVGEVIPAMIELLRSPLGKIASNMKFEDRWSRAVLRTPVRNWVWDTMLAAHWLDCRTGITSIKFQAFVHLGIGTYDEHIKPYLQGEGGSGPNRIQDVNLRSLLLYNGLDSLLEYQVATLQRKAYDEPTPKGLPQKSSPTPHRRVHASGRARRSRNATDPQR